MELSTRRTVKRARMERPVKDRTSASGSHGEVLQLPACDSDSETAAMSALMSLASGPTRTHPWNTTCLDLQERILMHLPLQELGRAVCLGKAFRSAFQQRALQVEQGLILAGIAAFGRPLLEGVGRVLHRYRKRTDLATGCGAMRLGQEVVIDTCGTVTNVVHPSNHWKCQEPHAVVELLRHQGAKDIVEAQDLILCVNGPNRKHWACLTLRGPTRRSSTCLRNEAADLCAEHFDCLGAMFIIAHQAGQELTCLSSRESPQLKLDAHPVDPIFPGGESSVQHDQRDSGKPKSETPFQASQANLHPPHRRVAAGSVRRVCELTQPFRQQASGEWVEQGMITALKLVEGFQVPCCQVRHEGTERVFACENKRYCRGHRVPA